MLTIRAMTAVKATQRFSLLIDLFEVVIRFIVLVQVADHLGGSQQAEVLANIPDLSKLSKLSKPSLGIWVSTMLLVIRLPWLSLYPRKALRLKSRKHTRSHTAIRRCNWLITLRGCGF